MRSFGTFFITVFIKTDFADFLIIPSSKRDVGTGVIS